MITSIANPKIRHVRRLLADRRFRERENAFVVEGTRWLTDLIEQSRLPSLVFATLEWLQVPAHQSLITALSGPVQAVSDQVLAHASDTVTSPGVLAIVPMIDLPFPDQPTLLLILDRVGNPGNLGTMLRTAAAAGVEAVLLGPGCVDAYNPKALRGSMGAHLRLPIIRASWPAIAVYTKGLAVWVAAAEDGTPYHDLNWREPSALVIGSEAHGAGAEVAGLFPSRVMIPMQNATESLNAAIAAGIILFEAARQRSTNR
jgi:RNA methyltransferase, TrmH family